jgi:flagellar hook-associated protein 1 FlgK
MSLDGYYSAVIGGLGVQREDAQRAETNQKTLLNQIDNMRQSVCGVSLDEEMSKMIQYQKGYNAAARMLTTMNDMLDTLLNATR